MTFVIAVYDDNCSIVKAISRHTDLMIRGFNVIVFDYIAVFTVILLAPSNLDGRFDGANGVTILEAFLPTRSADDYQN